MQSSNDTNMQSAPDVASRLYENAALDGLVKMVEQDHLRLLDVGSGVGANMVALRASGHGMFGITLSRGEAIRCSENGFPTVVADARAPHLPFEDASFDGVLLSHVLEHVEYPERVLIAVKRLLRDGGAVYVALPNVLYYKQRWEFLRGRFRYEDTGILDRTHLRFFDLESARALIRESGFEIVGEEVGGGVPSLGVRRLAPNAWNRLDKVGLSRFPGLFGYHLLFKAQPK